MNKNKKCKFPFLQCCPSAFCCNRIWPVHKAARIRAQFIEQQDMKAHEKLKITSLHKSSSQVK